MKNLETNKFAAAVLIAGLIALATGKIADGLYHPDESNVRGYKVEVDETASSAPTAEKAEEVAINIDELMAAADIAKGAKVFKKCKSCHLLEPGKSIVGPSLYKIVGKNMAADPNFSYSKSLASIDKTWNYEELFAFLKKPNKYAPGTKMSFTGLKKPKDIANLIAYMESIQ